MNLGAIWGLLKETVSEWSEDRVPRLGAALAYYTGFSLAPLLLIMISIAGLVFGREAVQGQIVEQLRGLVGNEGAEAIQGMMQSAARPRTGAFAAAISVATLLFGASGVFGALQDSLNTIWEVTPKPGRGVLGLIKDRFISFTMVLGMGFLLLVALFVSAALVALGTFLGGILPAPEFVLQAINLVVSFAVITLLFAMIYKVLPDVEIRWGDVWIGAAFTALLFILGKFALGLYLGKSSMSSAYGAAGSLIVVLLWVYYSAQILFFGAEFTQVYANRFGSRVVPDEDAVPITEEARAEQGMPRKEQVVAADRAQQEVSGAREAHGEPQFTPSRRSVSSATAYTTGGQPQHAPSQRSASAATTHTTGGRPQHAQSFTAVGMTIGVAWLTLLVGLLIGAAGSLIGLLAGAVMPLLRLLRPPRV